MGGHNGLLAGDYVRKLQNMGLKFGGTEICRGVLGSEGNGLNRRVGGHMDRVDVL